MNIVLKNDVNTKVGNKILLKIWTAFFKHKALPIKIAFAAECVIMLACLLGKMYYEVFVCAAIVVLSVLICIFRIIGGMKKVMASYVERKFEFTDEAFRDDETTYHYSDISEVVKEKEFVLIRMGKCTLPIITENNRQQVIDLMKVMQVKNVKIS